MKKSLGLYIHIPFCLHKCPYCDFYSTVGKADYRRYTDALMLHMEDYSDALKNCVVDTIYIGGGTPSVLPVRMLCELLDELGVPYTCSDLRNSGRKITVQFNGTLRPEQVPAAEALLAHGCSRCEPGACYLSTHTGEVTDPGCAWQETRKRQAPGHHAQCGRIFCRAAGEGTGCNQAFGRGRC